MTAVPAAAVADQHALTQSQSILTAEGFAQAEAVDANGGER
ncbi:hypothetical protein [Micromonospora sp. RL09-050-HVF-A]|nr:hypothetical protein [Micromonospora sp. RL09-050-HVF-A]